MSNVIPPEIFANIEKNAASGDKEAQALLKKYKPEIPKVLKFREYLHYDSDEYVTPDIFAKNGITLDDSEWDLWEERFGTPFYEVTLECEFDTETFKTTIIKVNGLKVEKP